MPNRHGDLLFVHPKVVIIESTTVVQYGRIFQTFRDPLDEFMEKQSGVIPRKRDERLCQHGSIGMCDYCMPLQPYDAKYLEENKIKVGLNN